MARPSVTFRSARESDRKVFNWRYFGGADRRRPLVVTVNGKIVLVMEGDTVVYQNGSEGIADLVRARKRLAEAIVNGLVDLEAEECDRNARMAEVFSKLRGE